MKKLIFISPSFDNQGPRTIRISNISRNLYNKKQYSICLIKYRKGIFDKNQEPYFSNNYFSIIHILYRYLGIYKLSKFFSKAKKIGNLTVSNYLIKLDLLIRFRKNEHFTFVIVVSPFSNYLIIPWLRRRFINSNIILDVGDHLYLNKGRDNSDNFSFSVEGKALKSSDKIIVTNKATKDFFCEKYKILSGNIFIIPQGVNITILQNLAKENIEVQTGSLAYAGRFYQGLRDPDNFFKALEKQDKYFLNLYGSNWNRQEKNVIFHPRMDQSMLFRQMLSNEFLVFIDNWEGIQTSGKIYELLVFGKPLLFIHGSTNSTEAADLARNSGLEVVFCENSVESISEALGKLTSIKFNQQTIIKHEYSWQTRSFQYREVIEQ